MKTLPLLLVFTSLFLTGCMPGSRAAGASREASIYNWSKTKKKIGNEAPLIYLDAGHGGHDFGATNSKMGLSEKRLCLKVTKIVESHLRKMGYRVFLTRKKDFFVDLDKRVKMINKHPNAIAVSIHFNSSKNPKANGIEVFYYKDPENSIRRYRSYNLAKHTLDQMVAGTKANSRGVKEASFRVIRNTTPAAILIEAGFITNRQEAKHLASERYLQRLGLSIAQGIQSFDQALAHRKYLDNR